MKNTETGSSEMKPDTARKVDEILTIAGRLGYDVTTDADDTMQTVTIAAPTGNWWMIATMPSGRTRAHRSVYGKEETCPIVRVYRDLIWAAA